MADLALIPAAQGPPQSVGVRAATGFQTLRGQIATQYQENLHRHAAIFKQLVHQHRQRLADGISYGAIGCKMVQHNALRRQ